MTIEELRKFPGFESVNDEEAEIALKNIGSLAKILYFMWEEDEKAKNEEKEDRISDSKGF